MKESDLSEKDQGDDSIASSFIHISVLSAELINGLALREGGHYLDATVGGGGHSRGILDSFPDVTLVAIDQDSIAISASRENLKEYHDSFAEPFGHRVQFWQGNFAEYPGKPNSFDGIIADLGVSSPQLDTPERGFSFRYPAPLDMRMNQEQDLTAAQIINHWQEAQLADIFYHYGEERLSRRLAKRIVEKRPFQTTTELADAIAQSVPGSYRYGRIHPATRIFQALRIAVNAELTVLETFLNIAPVWLKPGGIIGMISFHSLEDRLVKHRLRENPNLRILTKKPIQAQDAEEKINPRARSAKLRFAQRLENTIDETRSAKNRYA
jgi:16S rRNA (cytosine1402-N4)-methyltransferase